MRRSVIALLAFGLIAGGCTNRDTTDDTNQAAERGPTATESDGAVGSSIDEGSPLFETVLEPAALEWRSPPERLRSNEPAFIHAVDSESGSEAWRLEVPFPPAPLLMLAGDQLIYSFNNRGDEEFVASIGLDGVPRWQATTEWTFHGPFYTDDEVLIGIGKPRDEAVSAKHALVALDLDDGAELWHTKLSWRPDADEKGWLTGGSGAVYLARADLRITAFDIATGTRRWSIRTPGHTYGAPFHYQGLVYVGTDTALLALDAFNGKERWAADTGGRRIASPQGVSAGNVVSRLKQRGPSSSVAAADPATGTATWINDSYGQIVVGSDVVVGYRRAEADDSLPHVQIWDGGDGRTLAEVDGSEARNRRSVAFADSAVFLGVTATEEAPGHLIAVDLTNGRAAWDIDLPAPPAESAADEAAVYVIANTTEAPRGGLHAVGRESGDILWTLETEAELRTRPLLASGLVFVVSARELPS